MTDYGQHIHLELGDVCTDFLDDTDSLVTEDHVLVLVMQVSGTQTTVRYPQENFIWLDVSSTHVGLGDFTVWRALECCGTHAR